MRREPAVVVAMGAVTAFGHGEEAIAIGAVGEAAPTALSLDETARDAGLTRQLIGRAVPRSSHPDRATALLDDAFAQVLAALPSDRGGARLGVAVGTSSGGMLSAEAFFRARHEGLPVAPSLSEPATYFAPLATCLERHHLDPRRLSQVVAACASSTIAIGLALRWLELDVCDLVIAGGYDAVGLFVAAGFEGLRATSPSPPRPFARDRDGMVLGEAAALVALQRATDAPPGARVWLTGFGASADATHITAPDRDGGGLVRAGRAALADAGVADPIALVSAHGTATPYNDSAEARAIAALAGRPHVHPYKAQLGHTLGAAGVVELLALHRALAEGCVPAAVVSEPQDPDASVRLARTTSAEELPVGLKLSAAFGGVTAALVLQQPGEAARPPREARPVGVMAVVTLEATVDREALAATLGVPLDRIARIDPLGQLTLAAVAALADAVGRDALRGAGIVAGHALATLDTNERFFERLLDKGARRIDPRQFPATSPNAGAGHASIFFDLVGPCFAVARGLDGGLEALEVAADLVAAGDADRMVVVAADDGGPAAQAWLAAHPAPVAFAPGAVALLLGCEEGRPLPQPLANLTADHARGAAGQVALRRVIAACHPSEGQ